MLWWVAAPCCIAAPRHAACASPSRTETKRSEFPRFYFVSDPTLLEILSLGSDPPAVVPHFQSGLFDSLSNVTFDKVGQGGSCGLFAGSVDTG